MDNDSLSQFDIQKIDVVTFTAITYHFATTMDLNLINKMWLKLNTNHCDMMMICGYTCSKFDSWLIWQSRSYEMAPILLKKVNKSGNVDSFVQESP